MSQIWSIVRDNQLRLRHTDQISLTVKKGYKFQTLIMIRAREHLINYLQSGLSFKKAVLLSIRLIMIGIMTHQTFDFMLAKSTDMKIKNTIQLSRCNHIVCLLATQTQNLGATSGN
jgi:hypothetical protein